MPNYKLSEYLKVTHKLSSDTKRDIFDIPFIEVDNFDRSRILKEITLIKYSNVKAKTPQAKYKIAHGFMFDKELERFLNNPLTFFAKVGKCYALATPDLSIDMDASEAQTIGIIEKARWFGRLAQEYGIKVIPTVGWAREDLDYICFAGLRDGGVFMISTLGVNNEQCYHSFMRGYKKVRMLFPNTLFICVGDRLDDMDEDVIYIPYKESFGSSEYQKLSLLGIDDFTKVVSFNG